MKKAGPDHELEVRAGAGGVCAAVGFGGGAIDGGGCVRCWRWFWYWFGFGFYMPTVRSRRMLVLGCGVVDMATSHNNDLHPFPGLRDSASTAHQVQLTSTVLS